MPAPSKADVQAQQFRTLARLDAVKHHFDTTPAQNRFKGKVGIITGVGSQKGIGYVQSLGESLLSGADWDRCTVDARRRGCWPGKVRSPPRPSLSCTGRHSWARLIDRLGQCTGAKALYVLDYDGSTLDEFAHELESQHSGLSVRPSLFLPSFPSHLTPQWRQVTPITADASSTDAISSLCAQALKEQGRLDFFFANAGTTGANMSLEGLDEEGVMQVMKVNVLRCVAGACWDKMLEEAFSLSPREGPPAWLSL